LRAVAYVHENPVKAGLVSQAEDRPWSNAGARRACASDAPSEKKAGLETGAPSKQKAGLETGAPSEE
jgi:hypothetical protein